MLQKHYVKAEQNSRTERRDVPLIIFQAKLANEEQAHSREHNCDGHEVAPMKLFADHERREYQYINWRGVLKEDRICGCGFFRGPNEQEQQQTIDQRCDNAESIYLQAVL